MQPGFPDSHFCFFKTGGERTFEWGSRYHVQIIGNWLKLELRLLLQLPKRTRTSSGDGRLGDDSSFFGCRGNWKQRLLCPTGSANNVVELVFPSGGALTNGFVFVPVSPERSTEGMQSCWQPIHALE
jgi:hypothetical protein